MIKKFTSLIFTLLFSISIINGQSFSWGDSEETGYEMNPNMVKSINVTSPDGSVWFVSMKEKIMSYQNMMGDCFLIHYNAEGERQAEYIINGALIVNTATVDDAGNLIIAGDYYGQGIEFWEGSSLAGEENQLDGCIAKISPQGNVNWLKNIDEFNGEYISVQDLNFFNNKIYLASSSWAATFVSTIDEDLNYNTIITQNDVSLASDIDIDSESNIYVTGSCAGISSTYNGVEYPATFTYTKYLVKYNSDYEVQWVEYVEDVTCVFPNIKIDNEDNIYWAGQLYNESTFDTITLNGPSWVNDFYIVKYNPEGHALWARELEETTVGDAQIASLDALVILPDNSIVVACKSRGTIDWGNGIITNSDIMEYRVVLLNINGEGIAQWAKSGGNDSYSTVNSISSNDEGDLFVSGIANETMYFDDVEISSETFYYPFIVDLETGIVTGSNNNAIDNEIVISPNPATNYFNISLVSRNLKSIQIFALNGKMLMESETSHLNIQSFDSGIYLVKITTVDGNITSKKLIVQ
ncbi:MAG: hypothetical protein C0598_03000 [Marinilabiliales bacterium]|nr:MAG: hypothetical protein C0598_03000 [Marinilabiliales bacterium]